MLCEKPIPRIHYIHIYIHIHLYGMHVSVRLENSAMQKTKVVCVTVSARQLEKEVR